MHLILASASPRRAELLSSAGYTFEVVPAHVDESPFADEQPRAYALRVATDKAEAVRHCRKSGSVLLAADTVVVVEGRILGKPVDADDARGMLKALSGGVHEVHTAVVLAADTGQLSEIVTTRVHLLPLSRSEVDWYIATGEFHGKAGGYAIQGRAARFVDSIEGSWSNVVGLPVATVYRLLRAFGEHD